MIRSADVGDFESIVRLYRDLHPRDAPLTDDDRPTFETIIATPGLDLLLLDEDGQAVATTYLNVIPNLTRASRPYAVIENVVVDADRRREGLGQRVIAGTLERAWSAGCYKAMLQTGSTNPSTHAFYRACGFDPDAKTAYLARP